MDKITIGVRQNKKGLICSVAAALCSVIGLVMYVVTTINTNGEVNALLVVISAAATLLALVSCFLFYVDGLVSMVSAAFLLYCMLMFVSSQADSIGYAAAGIVDIGYGIQGTLIFGGICYLIAVVGECISVFDRKESDGE